MEQESQKIIRINYEEKDCFKFNTLSPNIEEFVEWVVENNYLESNKFKIDSEIEEFDIHTFEKIIKNFIYLFSQSLEIEKISFQNAMEEVSVDSDPESIDI